MNFAQELARIEWEWRSQPSKARLLQDALRQVEAGLQILASNGIQWRLEEGLHPARDWTWPRTYYNFELGPKIVGGPGQLEEMGAGWFESPGMAAQAYGEDVQFAGRGGVQRNQSLALVPGEESEFQPTISREEIKAQFRAERLARLNGGSHGSE